MYYIMEQSPGGQQLLDYEFHSLDEAKRKKFDIECTFHNSQFCNYYILKLISTIS